VADRWRWDETLYRGSPHVAVAIGVDADPEMIAAAKTAAEHAGTTNVEWHCMRAEALPADLGRLRFEADLHALLNDAAPDRRFSERMRDVALEIWRAPLAG
jgi:23S rRNA G2445 N2-methylase RlmL